MVSAKVFAKSMSFVESVEEAAANVSRSSAHPIGEGLIVFFLTVGEKIIPASTRPK